MKTILHKAGSRGLTETGWLSSRHTFSFGDYFDQDRIQFGLLRVLNDDIIHPSGGFPLHPHRNMEIVSIPISGALKHGDSMGNTQVIGENEIQVMSAGSGIYHSEYNASDEGKAAFLQIWIFPEKENVVPRYDQKKFSEEYFTDRLAEVISPMKENRGLWLHQQAWFSIGDFSKEQELTYTVHSHGNGLYLFVIKGEVIIDGTKLTARDGMGLYDTPLIACTVSANTRLLLMEVPMD